MTTSTSFTGFPAAALQFFHDLALNNNREWFKAHEADYRRSVLEPAQAFVISLGERLRAAFPGVGYDPRANGGSIMRIYRDIRFSADKSPYHTNLRLSYWEGPDKKGENPGYFLSLDDRGGEVYAGMHMFEKDLLEKYRAAAADPVTGGELEAAIAAVQGAGGCEVGGESYKRVPAGYSPDHERAALLRYGGLYARSPRIEPAALLTPALVDTCFEYCRSMAPINGWLSELLSTPS